MEVNEDIPSPFNYTSGAEFYQFFGKEILLLK